MINIGISLLLAILGFSFFSVSLSSSKLNNVFINMPKEIFESATVLSETPYHYDKDILEKKVESYVSSSLKPFVTDYSLSYYYYLTSSKSYCVSKFCDGVEVTLKSKVFVFDFKRTMYYEISKS